MRSLRFLVLGILLAACFQDAIPTEQVGGTKYDLFFSVPAATARPFPAAAVAIRQRTVSGGPLVDSVNLTLSNLVPIAGSGGYTFYLVDGRNGSARAMPGRVTVYRTDTTFNQVGIPTATVDSSRTFTATSIQGLAANETARVRIASTSATDSIGSFTTHVVVTIQQNTATPQYTDATPKPLSFRFRSLGANAGSRADDVISANGNALFGTFAEERVPTRVFSVTGTGRGGLWDRFDDGKLWVAGLAFSLSQPPVGYYYQPWIRDVRTGRAVPFGELRDTTTGESVRDADLRPITGPVATIPSARFSSTEDSIGQPLVTFNRIDLVVEPKLSALTVPGTAAALRADFGDTITFRGLGAVQVDVRRGGQPLANANVLVRKPSTGNLLGAPRPATTPADGRVWVTGIPADSVDVVVFAPGSATPTTSRVLVVRRDTATVTVTVP